VLSARFTNSFKGFKGISFLLILKQNHSVRFLKYQTALDSKLLVSAAQLLGVPYHILWEDFLRVLFRCDQNLQILFLKFFI
jgi:hypothetical protein